MRCKDTNTIVIFLFFYFIFYDNYKILVFILILKYDY